LVPVSVIQRLEAVSKPEEMALEVVLAGGRRIGVRPGFDPGTLDQLKQHWSESSDVGRGTGATAAFQHAWPLRIIWIAS